MKITPSTLHAAMTGALTRHGMDTPQAEMIAGVFLDAELRGKPSHGAFHLVDYLRAMDDGAINPRPNVLVNRSGSVIQVDADEGLAQWALQVALEEVVATAGQQGVAVCAVSNTYTTGELGWYPRLLAHQGLISFTTTNSPALVATGDDGRRTVGTNPLAFGIPDGIIVDQAISEGAYLKVRQAAARGERLEAGWAVDKDGRPTTDAGAAVDGAMVPFGGQRGANLALIMEMLAMLADGVSSLEASRKGNPGVGLFVLALDPRAFPGAKKLVPQLELLAEEYGVYLPGRGTDRVEVIELDESTWTELTD